MSTSQTHQKDISKRRPPYRIREIAQQAGLSPATVDRVLHERPGVRASTVAEVHRAIADLGRQRTQLRLGGRTFLVDLVMVAPARFTSAVRHALEAELPTLRPAAIRSRFWLREAGTPADVARVLDDIARRGSAGVILKAPDDPTVNDAIARLADSGVATVTLVTDLPASRRVAYVGMDNRAAGATAAYLLTAVTGFAPGTVLVTISRSMFRGEEEREMGFRAALRTLAPHRSIHEITDTDGLDATLRAAVAGALERDPAIDSVYSIGGGNTATLDAFDAAGRVPRAYLAHDLDDDNVALLRQGRLTAVLHHDLRFDMRQACRLLLQ
ncbi:MAG TPA: LacI family DNA-binding transcriptional regulator, partial [Jatrophihabitans sp.]|nr:LacI family DNA-binding transcriptional regulator [Jatrophihabitans sp.]